MTQQQAGYVLTEHDALKQVLIFHERFHGYPNYWQGDRAGLYHLAAGAVAQQPRRRSKCKDFTIASILEKEGYEDAVESPSQQRKPYDSSSIGLFIPRLQFEDISDISSECSENSKSANGREETVSSQPKVTGENEVLPNKSLDQSRLPKLFRPWMPTWQRDCEVPDKEHTANSWQKEERNTRYCYQNQMKHHEMKFSKRTRTVFSPWQIKILEDAFARSHFLNGEAKIHLAQLLKIKENTVKIWFQNRRMKHRRQLRSKSAELT